MDLAQQLRQLPQQGPELLQRARMAALARGIARRLRAEHPGLDAAQIADRVRAELEQSRDPRAPALTAEIARRLPQHTTPAPTGVSWPSALVLIAANLAPLYGVLALGWEVFPLMLLFWLENVVIGVLNVARMLCVDPHDPASWAAKLFLVPFFCFHYGMFTAVHGVFVFSLFGGAAFGEIRGLWTLDAAARAVQELGLGVPVLALAASHLFSFVWNYVGRGEFRRATVSAQMGRPYGRVVVLHLAILGGGFAALALGSPLWALLLLLALKIGLDLGAHLREHR